MRTNRSVALLIQQHSDGYHFDNIPRIIVLTKLADFLVVDRWQLRNAVLGPKMMQCDMREAENLCLAPDRIDTGITRVGKFSDECRNYGTGGLEVSCR